MASDTRIIRIPGMSDLGVRVVDLADEREDLYIIRYHVYGIQLGPAFLSVQEVAQRNK